MPKATNKDWTITIGFRPLSWFRKNWPVRNGDTVLGLCVEKDLPNRKLDIFIQEHQSITNQVGVLFHEFTHALLHIFLTKQSRHKGIEEDFSDGMALYGKALFNWFLNKAE